MNIARLLTSLQNRQADRTNVFNDMCNKYRYVNGSHTSTDVMKVIYLKQYNTATTFIPKIGSTFMTLAFSFFHGTKSDVEGWFTTSRRAVHRTQFGQYKHEFDGNSIQNITTILFSRNPYSRLFSAYIDKIYILNCYMLASEVLRYTTKNQGYSKHSNCVLNVSFPDFLDYALNSQVRYRYEHYDPTTNHYVLPVVCQTQKLIIVKQETFTSDIEYAFSVMHVEDGKRETIHNLLHYHKAKSNVASIVKTSYAKYRKLMKTRSYTLCVWWRTLAERLWKSFQIQGYINERSQFPSDKLMHVDELSNETSFLKTAFQELERRPLSREQSFYQRQRALAHAYADISPTLLKKFVEKYKTDFDFFQYEPHFK